MKRALYLIVLSCLLAVTPLGCAQEARQADPRAWEIVFDSPRDGNREIYVMDSDGSQQQLTHTPGESRASGNPDWSPDGKKIAFVVTEGVKDWDDSDIYVMDADGANLRRLTRTPGRASWDPRWSPDGEKIIWRAQNSRAA